MDKKETNEGKVNAFFFNQSTQFRVNETKDDIEVVSYNSPYHSQDNQTIDDVKFAILQRKAIDIGTLKSGTLYEATIKIQFMQNADQSWDQPYAELISLQEVK